MDIEKIIEAIKSLKINNLWMAIVIFVTLIAPGLFAVYVTNPTYLETFSTSKLILFSMVIISPIFVLTYLLDIATFGLTLKEQTGYSMDDHLKFLEHNPTSGLMGTIIIASLSIYFGVIITAIIGAGLFVFYLASVICSFAISLRSYKLSHQRYDKLRADGFFEKHNLKKRDEDKTEPPPQ